MTGTTEPDVDRVARELAEDYALKRGEWAFWEDLPDAYQQRWRDIAREQMRSDGT